MAPPPSVPAPPLGPLLRGIIEAFQLGIVLVDQEGTIIMANDALKALLGYGGQSLMGQPINALIPARFHAEHAAHLRAYALAPRLVRRMGSPLPALHADGTEVLVQADLIPLVHDGYAFTMAVVQPPGAAAAGAPTTATHGRP